MIRFLLKSGVFLALLALTGYMVFLAENGASDAFYLRLTSPRQGSLVLGNSRAAQGLVPSVLNEVLADDCHYPVYNYSFTIGQSPFGKPYLESIKRKLLEYKKKKGIFIIAVDTWSISVNKRFGENDSIVDNRTGLFLAGIEDVSAKPNFDYLLNYYPRPYYEILLRRIKPGNLFLHPDGWLEVSIQMDSSNVFQRMKRKRVLYQSYVGQYHFSQDRFTYLNETIQYLKNFGEVYLVRLPVHKEILAVENAIIFDFNKRIVELATNQNVPYLDLTPRANRYKFTDGNHLHKSSSRDVSKEVALWIKQQHSTDFFVSH